MRARAVPYPRVAAGTDPARAAAARVLHLEGADALQAQNNAGADGVAGRAHGHHVNDGEACNEAIQFL